MDVKHYGGAENPYEVRKVAEAWGLDRDAYLFNVLKYIARAGKKTPELKPDLVKARDYIDYRIETLDREEPSALVQAVLMGDFEKAKTILKEKPLSPAQAWDDHECNYPDDAP